jgi:hypothetical protein
MTEGDALTFAIQGAFALFRTSMLSDFRVPYRYKMLSRALRQMRQQRDLHRGSSFTMGAELQAVARQFLAASAKSTFTATCHQTGPTTRHRRLCAKSTPRQ